MEALLSKVNLLKADPLYYRANSEPKIVDLDTYYYVSMEGKGDPGEMEFLLAIQSMYSVVYGIKFICKGEDNDFVVPKMECHWFIDGGMEVQHSFVKTPRDQWRWKIMFRMPDFVEQHHFFQSLHQRKQKKADLEHLFERIIFELVNEGKCVQIMHIGAWDDEGPTLQKLFNFVQQKELKINGYHKEIYISEPRLVAEQKRKTILRYQVV